MTDKPSSAEIDAGVYGLTDIARMAKSMEYDRGYTLIDEITYLGDIVKFRFSLKREYDEGRTEKHPYQAIYSTDPVGRISWWSESNPRRLMSDVLGNRKAVPISYVDGSYECPFCNYPVLPDQAGCESPSCIANPSMSPVRARSILEERDRRAAEEAARVAAAAERAAIQAKLRSDRLEAEQRAIDEVRSSGYCVACYIKSLGRKRVRHRTRAACPHFRI